MQKYTVVFVLRTEHILSNMEIVVESKNKLDAYHTAQKDIENYIKEKNLNLTPTIILVEENN